MINSHNISSHQYCKVVLLFMCLLILAGCGAKSGTNTSNPVAAPAAKSSVTPAPAANADLTMQLAADKRKVIETGQVTLESRDLPATEAKVMALLAKRQGKVESSSVSLDNNGRRNGNYSLRVPSGKLTDFVNELVKIPEVVVRQRNLSSQDVTEEFVDITARLANMQRHENRLREILAKANSVDEILKVEKELSSVRGQIESTTGRLKSLSGKIDMSTLKLRISEVTVITETNFFGKLMAMIRDSWVAAGDVVLYLVATIIVLSPIAIVVALIVWWWKRRHK